jgi:hypothetical protein
MMRGFPLQPSGRSAYSRLITGVADPGSGDFLTRGDPGLVQKSGSEMNNPDHISEIVEIIF